MWHCPNLDMMATIDYLAVTSPILTAACEREARAICMVTISASNNTCMYPI